MTTPQRSFQLILIKPSHYDDDGYVIQWVRSSVPSNTLAALFGLGMDCAARSVLGPNLPIEITALDETNTRIRVDRIARQIKTAGGGGLVALVGVQSNQFPRAVDLGRQFVQRGIPTCIGGFHVSGCLAMLPEVPADLVAAMDAGLSLFAGELEGRMDALLADAQRGELQSLYNYMSDLPSLEGTPVPHLPTEVVERMSGSRTSFDAGRGCPFLCSFCTIINVQGRTSRYRSPDDVERILRSNLEQGIHKFFITDDNFARNKIWEPLFDRMIELRREGLDFKITIQVDTLCHKIPGFIEKAQAAGVDRVFIGLESINPDTLNATGKRQNKITEYRTMLQAWHGAGALTLAGYIIGFPADTTETVLRDIRIIQRELPIDLLYFFILTPLPGSQDHKELVEQGVELEPDMNNYDAVHVTAPHARMTAEEILTVYEAAWDTYYSPEHVERVMLRGKLRGFDVNKIKWMMLSFFAAAKVEGIHPMDSGVFRRKVRRDRRSGRPLENPLLFYPRYTLEQARKLAGYLRIYFQNQRLYRRVMSGRSRLAENDIAIQPVSVEELETLEIFATSEKARGLAQKSAQKITRKAKDRADPQGTHATAATSE